MRKFWEKPRNDETTQEEQRPSQVKHGGNRECEETIIKDKQRFGRVRKSTMQDLREEYGREIADRALWRVSKRQTRGCLQEKNPLSQHNNLQDLVRSFLLSSPLGTSKVHQNVSDHV